jgi:hypothetical protein
MLGAAMTPRSVTEEPTMPVEAAKIVAVRRTAMYSEPRTGASISCTARNSRSMRPDCSSR